MGTFFLFVTEELNSKIGSLGRAPTYFRLLFLASNELNGKFLFTFAMISFSAQPGESGNRVVHSRSLYGGMLCVRTQVTGSL
jgi:hypothetical protein